jgi:hypothetical protein
MNFYNDIKHWLKLARWKYRRFAVARRWGDEALHLAPAVLGNAMPKSGSHLISQVVQGLSDLGPFVNPGFPPVNRDEVNDKLSDAAIMANLERMRSGDLGYGYLKARQPFLSWLTQPGWATIFVYRDPRDMIVSHVFYATQMHTGHGMHEYYNKNLQTMEQRIDAAIEGVQLPGSELSPILSKYDGFLGWLEQSAVLSLRFEELILDRYAALGKIFDYLTERGFQAQMSRQQAITILQQAITPKKSGTFRKGQPGNWREHFTSRNIAFFKDRTGDLLMRLGYETSSDWS